MSLYGRLKRPGPSGFGYASTAEQVTDGIALSGKTYVLTGCNSGIGAETLRVLCARGARVLATARTLDKAKEATGPYGEQAVPLACELSDPASVGAAVASVQADGRPLSAIIANAGVMALPERTVRHGLELQFLTNHVGHFLFVTGLLDQLSPDGRVVVVSSRAHYRAWPEGVRLDDLAAEREYTPWNAYGQSKLANLLFASHLATRLPAGQTANSLHPGAIATNLTRHMKRGTALLFHTLGPLLVAKSIPEGAATQCWLAVHPGVTATGKYHADCNPAETSPQGADTALARALWDRTEEIAARLKGLS